LNPPFFREERRDANEADDERLVRRRQRNEGETLVGDWIVPAMDGAGIRCRWASGYDHHRTGNRVPGEWAVWVRHAGFELAGIYDGERAVSGRGQYVNQDWGGRVCERESCAEPGRDAGGALLHGGVLPG